MTHPRNITRSLIAFVSDRHGAGHVEFGRGSIRQGSRAGSPSATLRAGLFLVAVAIAGLGPLSAPLHAQIGPDEAVRKILDSIDEELKEIDRMLMQSSDRNAVGDRARAEQIDKLIDETQSSQERVVRGIDQLIDELQKMQQQSQQQSSGGGEGQPKDQQRSQGELEDQEQTTRIDEPNPQPQGMPRPERQGEQQGEKQQGESEPQDSPNESDSKGENRPSAAGPDGGTDRVLRDADRARWGNLPKYLRTTHLREGLPQVPEKYRKLLDEYHRNNQRVDKSTPPARNQDRR